jgi:hypothetical protein
MFARRGFSRNRGFDAGDLPPEYERQVTWRHGVGLGLRYRR